MTLSVDSLRIMELEKIQIIIIFGEIKMEKIFTL
jgi:hypothetical protein